MMRIYNQRWLRVVASKLCLVLCGAASMVWPLVSNAQCGAWDNRFGVPIGLNDAVRDVVAWDQDGNGPMAPFLIACGRFTSGGGVLSSRIARWDGVVWQNLGAGIAGFGGLEAVQTMVTWDPDGDGPLADLLIIAGQFYQSGNLNVRSIAAWDGNAWFALGSGVHGIVHDLTVWDPDGDGPLAGKLIAAGEFSQAGEIAAQNIAMWNGTVWEPIGEGLQGRIYALSEFDPDGAGPLPSQIVAGGVFQGDDLLPTHRVARWDGASWQPMSTGITNGEVYTLYVWDEDGDGPQPPQLVAGGTFLISSSSGPTRAAVWDGNEWKPLGGALNSIVQDITSWDPDGPGGMPPELVIGGDFTMGEGEYVVARLSGSTWQPVGETANSTIYGLTSWDPDGSGPMQPVLVAGGNFTAMGDLLVNRITLFDGSQWSTCGDGPSSWAETVIAWDPDGQGPLPQEVVLGGNFKQAGGTTVNHIARWSNGAWLPMGAGFGGSNPLPYAMTTWDPDGEGPLAPALIVGGGFTTAGATTVNRIARWDGQAWHPLGIGVNNQVEALTSWDPDGDGPQPEVLVAAGLFSSAGGVSAFYIARWDGTAWQPFGTGTNQRVYALTTWDPDGDGPLTDQLVAGGFFTIAGGHPANRIARWDGSAWHPIGEGVGGHATEVQALTTWDPDGPGPLHAQLIAGGNFTTAGGSAASRIARWDGSAWHPLGSGMNNTVRFLKSWDPDGAGPLHDHLVAAGQFTTAGGTTVRGIARWDGSSWHSFENGVSGMITSLTEWQSDPTDPVSARLVAAGTLTSAGGRPAARCIMWSPKSPSVVSHPQSVTLFAGETLTLAAVLEADAAGVTVQWRRSFATIFNGLNGASPYGGYVIGASESFQSVTTPEPIYLTILNARESDSGNYRLHVTHPCGNVQSFAAIVTVLPSPCPIDFNGDDGVDDLDITAFFAAFEAGDPSANLNGDDAIDDLDITAFFAAFEAGC